MKTKARTMIKQRPQNNVISASHGQLENSVLIFHWNHYSVDGSTLRGKANCKALEQRGFWRQQSEEVTFCVSVQLGK